MKKMRKMKKALAVALSAAMVMGTSMTTLAAGQEVSVDAPIYAYDVTNVIVPTNFLVAFNPNGLRVDTDGGDDTTGVTTNQIVSKNYGIINKSTKDKVITVTLKVEDLNGGKITFASSAADVTAATEDDYVINLTVVPADATEVKVGGNPADLTTTGADLADVTMTAASTEKVLVAGENDVDFLLTKADYDGKINLGSATDNNVADEFTIQNLATGGKGITAFTFGGTMNAKADWTKLTKGIKITAVYDNDNAPEGAAAEAGTGALYNNPKPVFKAGSGVGTIKYKPGTGNDAVASITSITMENSGNEYDGFNSMGNLWPAATNENNLITFSSEYMQYYWSAYPDDVTREAEVTYMTVGGETRIAHVDILLKQQIASAPSFETGSGIGTISYESGSGDAALSSITKIEMDNAGTVYDGYNVMDGLWAAATDNNGMITLSTNYMQYFISAYPSDTTRVATITYVTAGGETKTATVDVKLR